MTKDTTPTRLWDDTHVYRISAGESRLVGINAWSKAEADRKLDQKLRAPQHSEYIGELNELLEHLADELDHNPK